MHPWGRSASLSADSGSRKHELLDGIPVFDHLQKQLLDFQVQNGGPSGLPSDQILLGTGVKMFDANNKSRLGIAHANPWFRKQRPKYFFCIAIFLSHARLRGRYVFCRFNDCRTIALDANGEPEWQWVRLLLCFRALLVLPELDEAGCPTLVPRMLLSLSLSLSCSFQLACELASFLLTDLNA